MSLAAAVSVAVRNALYHDNKAFDPKQVMNKDPYNYDTSGKIRDFLLDVAHELMTDTPRVILDVDQMDLEACMSDTVIELEGDIANASS